MTDSTQGLEISGVSVSYGATVALRDVSLRIPRGQIVGLMGHNGAGKSTLLNVLSGATAPDTGSVSVGGSPAQRFGDPRYFAQLGVTAIHQEPALAPNLGIRENLLLGRPARVDGVSRRDRIPQALADAGLAGRDPRTPVSVLSLGERQLVDLARGVLDGDIRALLLDEPAAALGLLETQALHARVRSLSDAGTSVVYVSHRLPDILDVCDRIVVLREGQIMLDQPAGDFDAKTLASALADGADTQVDSEPRDVGAVFCSMELAQGAAEFRSGEIVGLFGVAAGPQFEALESLFRGADVGALKLAGSDYHPTGPAESMARGVHLVPGDREKDGLVATLSAQENVFLPWNGDFRSRSRIDFRTQRKLYQQIRREFNIRGPGGNAAIGSFSGGNRQKHLIARWTSIRVPRLLLMSQPTQGVDEAAKADIRRAIHRLAARGVAVVVASAESDELSSLCDRVYAMTTSEMHEYSAGPELDEQLLTFISGEHLTSR